MKGVTMYNLFRSFSRKITVLFLTVLTVLSQMGSLSSTISAANVFPKEKLSVTLQVPSGDIPPGQSNQSFKVTITPERNALEEGYAAGGFDDVVLEIVLPEGSAINSILAPLTVNYVDPVSGITKSSSVTFVQDTSGTNTILRVKITNIDAWLGLGTDLVTLPYDFSVTKLFPNHTTYPGEKATVSVKLVEGATSTTLTTKEIKSDGGTVQRNVSHPKNTQTIYTQPNLITAELSGATSGSVPYSVTGATGVITATLTAATALSGVNGPRLATITQVIKPNDLTRLRIDEIVADPINGQPGIPVPGPGTGEFTVTWTDVPIYNDVDTYTTSVTITKFTYFADKIWNYGGTSNTGSLLRIDYTTTANYKNNDPDPLKVIYVPKPLSGYSYITAKNPFVEKSFDSSTKSTETIVTDEFPGANPSDPGQRYVVGGYNFLNDPTWTLMKAIMDPTAHNDISYQVSDFGNKSGQKLFQYKVTQDLGIFNPSSGLHDAAYEKLYVTDIYVPVTTGGYTGSVSVSVVLASGTVVSLGTFTEGSTIYLDSIAALTGLRLDNGRGNIKSVVFDYGEVPVDFGLATNEAIKVNCKVIPHYVYDEVDDEIYVWRNSPDLSSYLTDGGDPVSFTDFNKAVNDLVDKGYFFGGRARVSFNDEDLPSATTARYSDNSNMDGIKTASGKNGIEYYNSIPTVSSNKSIYNVTKDSTYLTSYETGDQIEFIIALRNNDKFGDDRALDAVWLKDFLDEDYIDRSGASFKDATWEIYD